MKTRDGAGNRTRTGDIHLGKVALYQLSYSRPGMEPPGKLLPTSTKHNLIGKGLESCQANRPGGGCNKLRPDEPVESIYPTIIGVI